MSRIVSLYVSAVLLSQMREWRLMCGVCSATADKKWGCTFMPELFIQVEQNFHDCLLRLMFMVA